MKSLILAVALVLVMCLGGFSTQNCGPVVLVGGGRIPQEAVSWLKQRTLKGEQLILSCDADCDRWFKFLDNPIVIEPEELPKKNLANVGLIIIEGGDQWEYLTRIGPASTILQTAHQSGIPILGTSAGAMILGDHYFTAEKGTITSEQAAQGERICLGTGFLKIKFLKGLFVETHCQERDRKGRLEVFMKMTGAKGGIGIDESTALCIDTDGSYLVCGKGSVEFVKNRTSAK